MSKFCGYCGDEVEVGVQMGGEVLHAHCHAEYNAEMDEAWGDEDDTYCGEEPSDDDYYGSYDDLDDDFDDSYDRWQDDGRYDE